MSKIAESWRTMAASLSRAQAPQHLLLVHADAAADLGVGLAHQRQARLELVEQLAVGLVGLVVDARRRSWWSSRRVLGEPAGGVERAQ